MSSKNNPETAQTEPDYGQYKGTVEALNGFKGWLKKVVALNEKKKEAGLPPMLIGFSPDYENWNSTDIKDLYFSRSWGGR